MIFEANLDSPNVKNGSKPSTSYFKRDFCTAYLHQKVPKFFEVIKQKKSSCQTSAVKQERFFVEITGNFVILAS